MKQYYQQIYNRFDAFSLRERLMFTIAILLIIYMAFDAIAISSLDHQRDMVAAKIKDFDTRNKELGAKILEVSSKISQFSNINSSNEVKDLQDNLEQSNKKLKSLVVEFVKPQEMVQVLREVLKDVKGLKLMRVKSIGVVNLMDHLKDKSVAEQQSKYQQALRALRLYQQQVQVVDEAKLQGKVAEYLEKKEREAQAEHELPQIYKHGILIELRGSYAATLQYLRMLEKLPWKFYWEAMRFEIEDYPIAKITIIINTLSLNKEWVRV